MEENKKSGIGIAIAQIVMIATCFAAGWIAKELMPAPKGPAGMPPMMMGGAQSAAVTNAEMRVYNLPERFVAHAEPVQEVDLLPQVDGYIKKVLFKEGDIVEAGDVLYVLDDERYQAVVNQRKADLSAREAEERRTKRMYDRLLAADARGITQLERDNAEAAWETAKAAVAQAKANLVVSEYDLKKSKVIAPITGQIGKSSAHVGDYVAPLKGALARIVQVDPIRVTFPLTDRNYIAWRQAKLSGTEDDLRMRLILPNGSEYNGEGTWDFDDNQMSKETATIIMRLSFPNPDRLLVPNSYVTLLTDFQNPPSYPSVPQSALFDLPGGNQAVWIVGADGKVEARPVTTKEAAEGWSPITSGVKVGEKVVFAGVHKLQPGAVIKSVEPTPNEDVTPGFKRGEEE